MTTFKILYSFKDLKYISQYLPNNKCDINVDHHDHENEKEHLHKHSKKTRFPAFRSIDLSVSEPNLKTQNLLSKTTNSNQTSLYLNLSISNHIN